MASRSLQLGAAGQHVAQAVANLRHARGWDQRTLAARLTDAGRPVSASIVGKIEAGTRRVDVDDLVALGVAFEVLPARLLPLPAGDLPTRTEPPGPSDPFEAGAEPGPVRARLLDDLAALGDLEELDSLAPTLGAAAVRLAQEIDAPVSLGNSLPGMVKELRAVVGELRAMAPEEPDDDDDLADLASPD
ncbi:helix-turn-helix domain-containing protein [Streptomyces sp. NPDC102487]|uniref:helix-turn-helix domain-containing protein n=1 Tax=Streptomyces sp. NPDC102487 TaxID=3366182 RepID=UPI003826733B